MKKALGLTLKIAGGVLLTMVVVMAAAAIALQTPAVQDRLLRTATGMLTEQLQTEVGIDTVRINLLRQELRLRGVEIEDRQGRKMFVMRRLDVHLALLPLLRGEVRISRARITGLYAELYKASPDTAANYQFFIDAFKKEKTQPDTAQQEEKTPMTLDVKEVRLEDVKARYNDSEAQLEGVRYRKDRHGLQHLDLRRLRASWHQTTSKGERRHLRAGVGSLKADEGKPSPTLRLDSLFFATDNHLPRKNTGKPHRGFFDAGHLDFVAQIALDVTHVSKDSVAALLTHAEVHDSVAGLHVQRLQAQLSATRQALYLSEVLVALAHTEIRFDSGRLQLPSKREGRTLAYATSPVRGTTQLRDISRPFAPALKDFRLPVSFSARMSGTDNDIQFTDILVNTPDKRLTVKSTGYLHHLKDKYKLAVHFDVHEMHARPGVAQDIIQQFPIKKFMMKQLQALGHLRYRGTLDVLFKHENFGGVLRTDVGDLRVRIGIDEHNKYLTGHVATDSVELGKALDIDKLGMVACDADFKFDISKPRTARMRRQKGGKLPMGSVQARVKEASYMKLKVRNVTADINSDGAAAVGNLVVGGRRTDMLCTFVFNNTEEMRKMKIKPGLRFHALSAEDQARKDEKQRAKEVQKAEKRQLKEAKRQEKAERKQREAEEKAQRKQQRAAEKAAKKAAKEAASGVN